MEWLIPWSFVGLCAVVLICGCILSMHGIGQRNPSRVADLGKVVVVLSLVSVMGIVAVNVAGGLTLVLMQRVEAQTLSNQHSEDTGASR